MTITSSKPKILAVNAGGVGNLHGLRARRLTENLPYDVTVVDLNRTSRKVAFKHMEELLKSSWDLVYLESTGISAGLPLLHSKHRYVVSSGDPIAGFFKATEGPLQATIFGIYEKLLYRRSAGFIGWTPYLTGRALELGAPLGVTIEGAVETERFRQFSIKKRQEIRDRLKIPHNHLVCGLVGSLHWVKRQNYCYGLELIETLKLLKRTDVTMLIVGDGDGKTRLEQLVPDALRDRVIFTGRLVEREVIEVMNAMNIGFITQTLDSLGNYRLTTKLPEYLSCGMAVAMSPVPGYYDYVSEVGWALPPHHPTSMAFHQICANWLELLRQEEIVKQSESSRKTAIQRFDYNIMRRRFHIFIKNLLL